MPPFMGGRLCSRSLVGVVVELADDAGDARLGAAEMVAAVTVAGEAPALAQRIQRAGDFAPVVAADRLDEVGVEHRRGRERELDGLETSRSGERLRGASRHRDLAGTAER